MRVKLAAKLLYDEWKSRPEIDYKDGGHIFYPRIDYLSFLKTQAQDSTAHGHAAYKLACRWISEL